MRNPQLYIGAIVLGVIALVVGVLYQIQILGVHPARAEGAFVVGAILLLIGIVGLVAMRPRGPA